MKITATAPTRIDLAGGTLDLYPLYLFLDNPLTVNASLSLRSRAEVRPLPGTRVRLVAEDLRETVEADSPYELVLGEGLDLLARAVRYYAPQGGLELRTRSRAPKGSGLGASSSLLMSISRALCKFSGRDDGQSDIIQIGSQLEAQNLGVPTGLQDYFGACLGGINGLEFKVGANFVRSLHLSPEFRQEFADSVIVSFTGLSHFSGTSNWNMLKRYIDREGDTVERMLAVQDTAHEMWDALIDENLDHVARALAREWDNRRGLAVGVTTPRIDNMIAEAKRAGALASKICGAGGGGCLLTLARVQERQAVQEALVAAGAEILEATIDDVGLQVSVEDAE